MSITVAEIARSQVGVVEDAGSNQDHAGYIAMYRNAVHDSRYQMKAGDAYCAAFVSWVLERAGTPLQHKWGWGISYVPWLKDHAEGLGIFDTVDVRYKPNVGDVVIYSERGERPDHTGIILAVEDEQYTSVEGNYNNGVNTRVVSLSDERIIGYFSPTDL